MVAIVIGIPIVADITTLPWVLEVKTAQCSTGVATAPAEVKGGASTTEGVPCLAPI